MRWTFLGLLFASAILTLGAGGVAFAEDCSGTITAEEALRAEDARYAAQTSNDFAAMDKLFGADLTYIHSSAKVDGKASYTDGMHSGRARYRSMKRTDARTRSYGCIAVITGTVVFEVTSGGQDRTIPLRFHSVWAKRADGIQFVSWQATLVPNQ